MLEEIINMIDNIEYFLRDKDMEKFPLLNNVLTLARVAKKKLASLPVNCEFSHGCQEEWEAENNSEEYNWRDDVD